MKQPTYTDMLKRHVIWIDVSGRVVKKLVIWSQQKVGNAKLASLLVFLGQRIGYICNLAAILFYSANSFNVLNCKKMTSEELFLLADKAFFLLFSKSFIMEVRNFDWNVFSTFKQAYGLINRCHGLGLASKYSNIFTMKQWFFNFHHWRKTKSTILNWL